MPRPSDKFSGQKICELSPEEFEELLSSAATRGAASALQTIGLNDEGAIGDIRAMRDILNSFRVVRHATFTAALRTSGRVIGWVFVIWAAGFFIHSPVVKQAISKIMVDP